MKIRQFLDRIDDESRDSITRIVPVDRWQQLDIFGREVQKLTSEFPWDWAAVYLAPLVITEVGKRNYQLPENFGMNFARGSDQGGNDFTVTLSDGSNESTLEYREPGRFYSRNLESESNGRPTIYTIGNNLAGRREIILAAPPDTNSDSQYTVNGLYVPTDWTFDNQDIVYPIPGNSAILEHLILAQVFKGRDADMRREHLLLADVSKKHLALSQAQGKQFKAMPRQSRNGNRNSYTLVRRR